MLPISLSREEKKCLQAIQRETAEKRIYRKVSTLLGLDSGLSITQLAGTLGIDETTIRRYKKIYIIYGMEKYLSDDYQSYWGKLTSHQMAQLIKELKTNIYTTAAQIESWIKKIFGISYNPQGLVHLLKALGFVYKKTKLIPCKADASSQKTFVIEYRQQQKDLGNDEIMYFCDAVHPQHNTNATYAWIQKGFEKEIKSNTGRTRININGALNPNNPTDIIVRDYKTINAETTIEFFRAIESANPSIKKIILYVDNARYYKNKDVEEYLKCSRIALRFLPVYSPNLNLIERLWKFMKKIVINNKYYEKPKEFRNKLFDFFDTIHIHKKSLECLITNNFQILHSR